MTDPNQTSGAAKTRRWFRRPWVLAIAAVLLIVGGIWANHRWERAKGRREIDKRLVRLRAIGVPADLSKFAEQFPDPPPEKNAERILGSGLHEIEFPSDWPTVPIFRERPIPGRLRAWSNEERAETWNYLESQQEALSKVSDSALEGAWFRPYVTNNFPYPHRWTYWLIGLLQLRALEPIESGSHDQAVHELEKSLAVIVALPQGTYRNHRGFTGWMSSGSKLMERLLNRSELTDQALKALQIPLSKERSDGLRHGLIHLTVQGIGSLERLRNTTAYQEYDLSYLHNDLTAQIKSKASALIRAAIEPLYSDYGYLQYLDLRICQLESLSKPTHETIQQVFQTEKKFGRDERFTNNLRMYSYVEEVKFSQQIIVDLELRVLTRATVVGLAIERYRLAHANALPESLTALVPAYLPEVPLDLFDGQPLRYRKLPKGYVVYSIGRDLTDDGGKEPPADPKPEDRYDLSFTVERPN